MWESGVTAQRTPNCTKWSKCFASRTGRCAPLYPQPQKTSAPIRWETQWASPESVWTLWSRQESASHTEHTTPVIHPAAYHCALILQLLVDWVESSKKTSHDRSPGWDVNLELAADVSGERRTVERDVQIIDNIAHYTEHTRSDASFPRETNYKDAICF